MFLCEWKKQLFHRRSIWLIAALLALELASVLLFTHPYDVELEEHRAVYESYLSQVEGPLTPEKRESIEAEMERLDDVHMELNGLKRRYYAGEISEEEFRSSYDALMAEDQRYTGFSKLYAQYIFVRESEVRSFLYTGGWEILLTDQEPDYLLLLVLVVVLAPVFCEEYETRMNEILMTQKRSARYQVAAKVTFGLILTALLVAAVQVFDLVYCAVRFGLPHGEYTLQSIQRFGSTEKEMTLWQAFWLQFALKEFGYLYAAVVLLALSVLFRKFAQTLMAGIAAFPLLLLTVSDHESLTRIPGPWAFTLGSIYFNGSIYTRDSQSGELIPAQTEVGWAELGLLVCVSLGIMALLLLYISSQNRNHHVKRRGKVWMTGCLVALLLTGCGAEDNGIIYNRAAANNFENDDYILILNHVDGGVLMEKAAGTVYGFPLNALEGETVSASPWVYREGEFLYYLKTTTLHPVAGFDQIQPYEELVRLDLGTLEEQTVYAWNGEADWFFGLLDRDQTDRRSYLVGESFLHGGYLYFVNSYSNSLCRMHLVSGEYETVLSKLNSQDLACDGQHIFYTDHYDRLVVQTLDSGEKRTVEEVVAHRFLLTEEGIYFLNRRDQNTLYYWDGTGKAVKLDDTPASSLYWDNRYLWIVDKENYQLHRMEHDGSNRATLNCPGHVCCLTEESALYLMDYGTDTLYRVDKDTLEYCPTILE